MKSALIVKNLHIYKFHLLKKFLNCYHITFQLSIFLLLWPRQAKGYQHPMEQNSKLDFKTAFELVRNSALRWFCIKKPVYQMRFIHIFKRFRILMAHFSSIVSKTLLSNQILYILQKISNTNGSFQ